MAAWRQQVDFLKVYITRIRRPLDSSDICLSPVPWSNIKETSVSYQSTIPHENVSSTLQDTF